MERITRVARFPKTQHPVPCLFACTNSAVPSLGSGGADSAINPFIRYWEPARFDRGQLERANQHHEQHRRRRRSINYEHGSAAYGPANVVRLNFRAHDREFRLVLREDPRSVFSQDVQIENTEGPMDYDLSRIYTGMVEEQRKFGEEKPHGKQSDRPEANKPERKIQ
uniref:Uncharacterized protein n=1 Tax=Anopheles farauti TaxID=69004 RepID=A0A182QZF1_9DIPT